MFFIFVDIPSLFLSSVFAFVKQIEQIVLYLKGYFSIFFPVLHIRVVSFDPASLISALIFMADTIKVVML
ncbi:MAG: hypothetical protein ABI045_05770 [Flavobacteriales bacterium]